MSTDDIKRLAVQVAALAQQLEMQHRESTQRLTEAAQRLEAGGRQVGSELAGILRAEARASFAQGGQQAGKDFTGIISGATREAGLAARSLRAESDRLCRGVRLWSSAALATLIVGSALAVAGSSHAVWKNSRTLARIEYQQQLQHLAETGVLVRCGDALCARIGTDPQRLDDEYVVLR